MQVCFENVSVFIVFMIYKNTFLYAFVCVCVCGVIITDCVSELFISMSVLNLFVCVLLVRGVCTSFCAAGERRAGCVGVTVF